MSFVAVDMNAESLRLLHQRAAATRLTNVTCVCALIEDYRGPVDVAFALHACGSATDWALLQAQRARAVFVVSPCCIGKLKYSIAPAVSPHSINMIGEVIDTGDTAGILDAEAATQQQFSLRIEQPVHPRSSFMRDKMGGSEFALLVQFADFADGACDEDCGQSEHQLQGLAGLQAAVDDDDAMPSPCGSSSGSPYDLKRTSRLCKVHVELDRIMAARDAGYWAQMMCLISPFAAAPNKLDLLVGAPEENKVTGKLQLLLSS
jgi:hypothetical protein